MVEVQQLRANAFTRCSSRLNRPAACDMIVSASRCIISRPPCPERPSAGRQFPGGDIAQGDDECVTLGPEVPGAAVASKNGVTNSRSTGLVLGLERQPLGLRRLVGVVSDSSNELSVLRVRRVLRSFLVAENRSFARTISRVAVYQAHPSPMELSIIDDWFMRIDRSSGRKSPSPPR